MRISERENETFESAQRKGGGLECGGGKGQTCPIGCFGRVLQTAFAQATKPNQATSAWKRSEKKT